MATMIDEYCMSCRYNSCIYFRCITRIEWNTEYKTIWFNCMLIDGTLIPSTIDCFCIFIAEGSARCFNDLEIVPFCAFVFLLTVQMSLDPVECDQSNAKDRNELPQMRVLHRTFDILACKNRIQY